MTTEVEKMQLNDKDIDDIVSQGMRASTGAAEPIAPSGDQTRNETMDRITTVRSREPGGTPRERSGGTQEQEEDRNTKAANRSREITKKAIWALLGISVLLLIASFSTTFAGGIILAIAILYALNVAINGIELFPTGKETASLSPSTMIQKFSNLLIAIVAVTLVISCVLYFRLLDDIGFALAGAIVTAAIIGAITSWVMIRWAKFIPNVPHHWGEITIFGGKTDWVVPDGWWPTIPGVFDYIPIKAEKIDHDFEPNIKAITRDGVEVEVDFSLSYIPDPERPKAYVESGQEKGVRGQVDNDVPAYVGDIIHGKEGDSDFPGMDLDYALGARRELADKVWKMLTGKNKDAMSMEMKKKGEPDDKRYGIRLLDSTATNIEPTAAVKKAMEQKRVEQAQRASETYEQETDEKIAESLLKFAKANKQDVQPFKVISFVKQLRLARETGLPMGLYESLAEGRMGALETALLMMTGMVPKSTEAKPVDVSRPAQRTLSEGEITVGEQPQTRTKKGRRNR